MIKKIPRPNFAFDLVFEDDGFYYDDNTDEYFFILGNPPKYKIYFNKNGAWHRDNKPAVIQYGTYGLEFWKDGFCHRLDGPAEDYLSYIRFRINGKIFKIIDFAKETNHLICNLCNKFCKQYCF